MAKLLQFPARNHDQHDRGQESANHQLLQTLSHFWVDDPFDLGYEGSLKAISLALFERYAAIGFPNPPLPVVRETIIDMGIRIGRYRRAKGSYGYRLVKTLPTLKEITPPSSARGKKRFAPAVEELKRLFAEAGDERAS